MRDDGWGREPPLPKARPRQAETPAREYNRPELERISVGLEVYDPSFAPSLSDSNGQCKVRARIPLGSMVVPEGGQALVDCGFGMGIPPGYRVRTASLVPGLLAEVAGLREFSLNLMNLGGETILNDGQIVGLIWIERVCFFDWNLKD